MKYLILFAGLLTLSTSIFAREIPKANLQKGASAQFCKENDLTGFLVRGDGSQREVTVRIEYSTGDVDMLISPPYSVSGFTAIKLEYNTRYCAMLTKL